MLGKMLSKILPRASTHEGASIGRRLRMWLPFDSGPKREHITLPMLRARSRDACRNNPIARAAVERMVTDVIGAGISPKPVIESEALRMRLIDQWEAWSAECDVDGQTDFYGLQTLALRAMLESGECFAVLDTSSAAGIPLRIRLLESDHLPFKNEKLKNGNIIVDGIEFDARGRRIAYWLHPRHPGDPAASSAADIMNEPRRITADRVIHLFEATRPGQIRGVPWLASVLVRLKTLDEFNDAQLERQKLANLFVGFIRRPPPEPGAATIGPDGLPLTDDTEQPPLVFEPGMLQELGPGEDVTFSAPPGTSTGYLDFTRAQLRDVASALGIPYAILTGDFDNVNDRVVRVAINEYKRRAIAMIRNVLVPKFCAPIRNAWCDAAVLSGALPSNNPVKATRWTPHGWAYLHPVQDVQADVLAINNKLKSRSEALLERGYDAELIDREIAADQAREKRLGIFDEIPSSPQPPADNELATPSNLATLLSEFARNSAPPAPASAPGITIHNNPAPVSVQVDNHLPEPVINLEATIAQPAIEAPAVHNVIQVESAPAPNVVIHNEVPAAQEVKIVSMPTRSTTTEITRDKNENILQTKQTERDE